MDDRIDLQEFYNGLDLMFQRKDSGATGSYLESWLRTAEEKRDLSGIVAVCNELGGFCRVTGQIDRAKELYARVRSLLEEMGLAATQHYATALINTGDVHLMVNELTQALELFLEAEKLLLSRGLDGDYRMAALCNNISMIYREREEFAKARQALDKAFCIIKGLPERGGELATTYVNLGELQVRQGQLEKAKESFLCAVKIFEEETGGADVHYSAACAGLGEVFYLSGAFQEAEHYYEKARDLIQRDFGKTPAYDMVCSNLEKARQRLRQPVDPGEAPVKPESGQQNNRRKGAGEQ